VSPAEYQPRYEAARRELEPELSLPALGPGARVVLTSGASGTGSFRGVGPGFVRFGERGQAENSIATSRIAMLRYYNVMLRAQGEPRPDVFRRLLEEPGAVSRFALDPLRDRRR
jgi:hypothetical protein